MTSALTLTVASAPVSVPEPDVDAPDTHVWHAPDGRPIAYFFPVEGNYWASLPGIGSYRVEPDGAVLAVPEPTASYSLVLDAYRRTVLPQALQFFGREVLHASAVVGPNGVVGFCAYSQTGKSTLAFALAHRGYRPWADDALAFEPGAETSEALALPFAVRLRPESQEYFAVEPLPPETEPQNGTVITIGAERHPISALCVLTRGTEDEPSRIEPLQASEAVTALLPHAYWSTLADEPRKARMVQTYLELTNTISTYAVTISPVLERLPTLLDELERTVLAPGEGR
jgi:hypothetical protein